MHNRNSTQLCIFLPNKKAFKSTCALRLYSGAETRRGPRNSQVQIPIEGQIVAFLC